MKFPLGDILRAIWPGNWLFKRTKGISIGVGEHEILLNKDHGVNRSEPAEFNQPHKPGSSR